MFADVEKKVEQHIYRNGGVMDHVERANQIIEVFEEVEDRL